MSYIRFGERGSDVYVYLTDEDAPQTTVHCCACLLDPEDACRWATDVQVMATHLKRHQEAGHAVPDGVIDAILDNPHHDPSRDRPWSNT